MRVLIIAATEKELLTIKQTIRAEYLANSKRFEIMFVETGVGLLLSCFSILKLIHQYKPDLVIQVGIAGTFDNTSVLGKVVVVKEETVADAGVEEGEYFKDLFDLNLLKEDSHPFSNRKLINPLVEQLNLLNLELVNGITINEITTRPARVEQYKAKYRPTIETMEGASLHYCCLMEKVPFIQFRAISNYIGERDKSKWNFSEAFKNLSDTVLRYLEHLYQTSDQILENE